MTALNSQQLVMRRDTDCDMVRVGWAVDLPLGRFEHMELLAESAQCLILNQENPLFPIYHSACEKARKLNTLYLQQQAERLRHDGWLPIDSRNLQPTPSIDSNHSDEVGSFRTVAMQLLYSLTGNYPWVWCVTQDNTIVRVQSRKAPKPMEELEQQVWKHHTLNRLNKMQGETISGRLVVDESGLWFCPSE